MDSLEEKNEIVELAASDEYLIFPPTKGKVKILINCDQDMPVYVDTNQLRKLANTIFKNININRLFEWLMRGETLHVGDGLLERLRPITNESKSPLPSLNDILGLGFRHGVNY